MVVMVFALGLSLTGCAQSVKTGDCGFSRFNPLEVPRESIMDENTFHDRRTHWAVTPVCPPVARAKRLSGTVHVRVLVDMSGRVVKTCPIYKPTEPRADESLVDAAISYVEKGRFRPNLGSPKGSEAGFRYAATTVDIHFILADQEK